MVFKFCWAFQDKSENVPTNARMLRRLLLGQPRRDEIKDGKGETCEDVKRYVSFYALNE